MTTTVPMTISLLFRVLCCIWFASEVTVAVATRTRGGKGNVRDRGSMLMLWIVITAASRVANGSVPLLRHPYSVERRGCVWLAYLFC